MVSACPAPVLNCTRAALHCPTHQVQCPQVLCFCFVCLQRGNQGFLHRPTDKICVSTAEHV